MKILIVEDDRAARNALKLTLHLRGHETCWASDGDGALRLMATENVDAVMLDLDLGLDSLDGWEVARRKMLDPAIAHIPVIITTGLGIDSIHRQNVPNPLEGALLTLAKPIDLKKLDVVLALLEKHSKPPPAR